MAAIAAADIAESKREGGEEGERRKGRLGRWKERWRTEGAL